MTNRAAVVPAACLVALAAAGCGGSGTSSASSPSSPSTPGTSSPTPPSGPSTTATTPTTPTTPAGPTGPSVRITDLSLRLPAGWSVDRRGDKDAPTAFREPDEDISIQIDSISNEGFPTSVAADRREYLQFSSYHRTPATLPTVMIDGHRWWHLRGRTSSQTYDDVYGTSLSERDVSLEFEGDRLVSNAAVVKVAQVVLPTVKVTP